MAALILKFDPTRPRARRRPNSRTSNNALLIGVIDKLEQIGVLRPDTIAMYDGQFDHVLKRISQGLM